MEPKFGWVEVFRSASEDEFLRLQGAAREAQIRCRVVEYNVPKKPSFVTMQASPHTTAAARGTNFGLNSAVPVAPDLDGEHIYSLQVKRRDLERFQALRSAL